MTLDPQEFVRRLMDEILRLHRLPKVQVERVVGPILGIFLPDVLGPLLDDAEGREGFEVVSPEFPLKRAESHQSTNVDWLVLHRGRGLVVLFELKTASDSIDRAQLETYERVRQRIGREGGAFLVDEVRQIRDASPQRAKYDALLATCADHEAALRDARHARTVCLVPAASAMPDTGAPVEVRHFRDLPPSIDGALRDAWRVVRESLTALDGDEGAAAARASDASGASGASGVRVEDFAAHVRANLRRAGEGRVPARFWIGNTGTGARPNYQVEFRDGSIGTYRYGGTALGAAAFDARRLRGPFEFPAA